MPGSWSSRRARAYSLAALSQDAVIGLRDPLGVRPLVLGRLGDAWIIASETCALDIIGGEFVRDVEPGEIVIIGPAGVKSVKPFAPEPKRLCVFEYIYFARPDSVVEGESVYEARKRIGRELAREAPVEADIVVPVPDSGVPAALGFAAEAGLPFELGIIRNHYVGRTFIEPEQRVRDFGVKLKLNPVRNVLAGKRVVLIDDSIVRGTTSKKIVRMVRDAGAKEVHMRISCPPTISPCYYGVDTPSKEQLIAANKSVEQIRQYIGADSLAYLSLAGLRKAVGDTDERVYCTACYTGKYPTNIVDVEEIAPAMVSTT